MAGEGVTFKRYRQHISLVSSPRLPFFASPVSSSLVVLSPSCFNTWKYASESQPEASQPSCVSLCSSPTFFAFAFGELLKHISPSCFCQLQLSRQVWQTIRVDAPAPKYSDDCCNDHNGTRCCQYESTTFTSTLQTHHCFW